MASANSTALEPRRIDLSSRVSVRAIIAGVLVIVAAMALLLSLGAAFGVFTPKPHMVARDVGAGFWAWSLISWIVSAFFGAAIAAMVARSPHPRDGLLHGLVTWAAACALGCATSVWLSTHTEGLLAGASRNVFWGIFLTDLLALGAALLGGLAGARSEDKAERLEAAAARPARGVYAPQGPTPQPT